MGFFDKLTGGAAEVRVAVLGEPILGEPFQVEISAAATSGFKINKVYLLVKAWEEVKAEGVEIEIEDGELEVEKEMVHKIVDTFNAEIEVDGTQEIDSGETKTWTVEVTIDPENNGTYRGVHARHEWQLYVGLDAFGNDPDSGWVGFEIY
jgi:hypothetical protein